MNDKNKSSEFSYYGLYLLKYLRENHPDRAVDVYEQSRLEGMYILKENTFSTINKWVYLKSNKKTQHYGTIFLFTSFNFRFDINILYRIRNKSDYLSQKIKCTKLLCVL